MEAPIGRPSRVTRRFDPRLALLDWSGPVEASYGTAAVAVGPGFRLTLLAAGRSVVPFGICLAPGMALPAPGEPLRLGGRRLCLRSMRVLLDGDGVELTVAGAPGSWSSTAARRQLAALLLPPRTRRLLDASPADDATDSALLLQVARSLSRLCDALRACDRDRLDPAVAGLAGLGPGATPTGDDLLAGATAAAHRLVAAALLPAHTLELLTVALRALPRDATTPVGREMLAHAADGYFVEPLPPLVEALGSETVGEDEVNTLAGRLVALGSWSGADLLAGSVAVLRAASCER